MGTWSWDQVIGRRLRRSHLLVRSTQDEVVEVVRAVCGAQAQVPAAAESCVGVRTTGSTRTRVRQLVEVDRVLTRTYAMRGTAQLLPSDELPLYLSAMRHLNGGDGIWPGRFGLDAGQADKLFAAISDVLDGRRLTRQQLIDELRQHAGPWVLEVLDPTLADVSVAAAHAGVLAYGPPQGGKSTFVRPDQWGGGWYDVEGGAALGELVRRYFAAYGPATHSELARWLGVTAARARQLMGSLGDGLTPADVAGEQAWLPATEAAAGDESGAGCVRLLPQYDCYVLGSGPIERIVPPQAKDLIRRRKRGRYEGAAGVPVLLVDGLVAGVWEARRSRGRLHVAVEPVLPLTPSQHADLEEEANRVARFDEANLALTVAGPG